MLYVSRSNDVDVFFNSKPKYFKMSANAVHANRRVNRSCLLLIGFYLAEVLLV